MEKIVLLAFAIVLFSSVTSGKDNNSLMNKQACYRADLNLYQNNDQASEDQLLLSNDSALFAIVNLAQQNGSLLDSVDWKIYVDSLQSLVNYSNQKLHYSESGNLYLSNYYLWNISSNSWYKNGETQQYFDSEGNIWQAKTFLYDQSTETPKPYWKYQNTYDNKGKVIQKTVYSGGINADDWINNYKDNYTYSGKNLLLYHFRWDTTTSNWDTTYYIEQTYDSLNQSTHTLKYTWDKIISQWKCSSREKQTYSQTGKILDSYSISCIDSTDRIEIKYRYTYDNSDNLIEEYYEHRAIFFMYYEMNNGKTFIDSIESADRQFIQYAYNQDNNLTKETTFMYNYRSDSYSEYDNTDYSYDESGNLKQKSYSRNYSDKGWQERSVTTYFYTNQTSAKKIADDNAVIKLYPNPASNKLSVQISPTITDQVSVELFDVKGNRRLSTSLAASAEISVTDLPKGIYICKTTAKQTSKYQRLVIK